MFWALTWAPAWRRCSGPPSAVTPAGSTCIDCQPLSPSAGLTWSRGVAPLSWGPSAVQPGLRAPRHRCDPASASAWEHRLVWGEGVELGLASPEVELSGRVARKSCMDGEGQPGHVGRSPVLISLAPPGSPPLDPRPAPPHQASACSWWKWPSPLLWLLELEGPRELCVSWDQTESVYSPVKRVILGLEFDAHQALRGRGCWYNRVCGCSDLVLKDRAHLVSLFQRDPASAILPGRTRSSSPSQTEGHSVGWPGQSDVLRGNVCLIFQAERRCLKMSISANRADFLIKTWGEVLTDIILFVSRSLLKPKE